MLRRILNFPVFKAGLYIYGIGLLGELVVAGPYRGNVQLGKTSVLVFFWIQMVGLFLILLGCLTSIARKFFPSDNQIQTGGSMALSPIQKKILSSYQENRRTPPTLLRLCLKSGLHLGILVVSCVTFLWLSVIDPGSRWPQFLAGMIAGIILFAVMVFQRIAKLWPFTKELINWSKVDELSNSHDA